MDIYDFQVTGLDGRSIDLSGFRGRTTLIVNVATKCGLTPQYEGLQTLCDRYGGRGFSIIGVPCNQFGEQEPGGADEIEACAASYAATFPLTEKLEVNGPRRHPLYEALTVKADSSGRAGDVEWNFEKFLISPGGEVVGRFRPVIDPVSDEILSTVESNLPSETGGLVWIPTPAAKVRSGDRVRLPSSVELTATRVEMPFLGLDDLVCLIEDTPARWLAHALGTDAEVQVLGS
jgi:glutathione peroxidase